MTRSKITTNKRYSKRKVKTKAQIKAETKGLVIESFCNTIETLEQSTISKNNEHSNKPLPCSQELVVKKRKNSLEHLENNKKTKYSADKDQEAPHVNNNIFFILSYYLKIFIYNFLGSRVHYNHVG